MDANFIKFGRAPAIDMSLIWLFLFIERCFPQSAVSFYLFENAQVFFRRRYVSIIHIGFLFVNTASRDMRLGQMCYIHSITIPSILRPDPPIRCSDQKMGLIQVGLDDLAISPSLCEIGKTFRIGDQTLIFFHFYQIPGRSR